ncbi:MAG TPA: hypothetical protein VFD66_13620 [Verrucomicrobiae bacterium]|nr:hypothetical protein [Verrucomicrobiae bacterium]
MKTSINSRQSSLKAVFSTLLPVAVVSLFAGIAPICSGQVITDFNFDSLTLGSALPTTASSVDSYPQHTVYSVGGNPNDLDPSISNPLTGTATVQNVGGLSKAAVMSTTQAGTGALYIDTQMLFTTPTMDLSFDIDVVTTPTTGLAQGGVGAPNGQAFAIQVFGLDAQRLLRFAVSPTSGTGGDFGYRLPGGSGDLVSFGSYIDGETHHVDIQADFGTSTMDIYLDGIQVVTGAALVSPGTGVSEVFMFQNGVDGQLNQVALDNIIVSVPEPSIWGLAFSGIAMLAGLRRFGRRSA